MALPSAADLIADVRQNGPGALDKYAPEVDELADTAEIAAWLGIQPQTIHRERKRIRVGRNWRTWPDEDRMAGRTPMWKWRTIIVHRADAPGKGNYPRQPRAEASK